MENEKRTARNEEEKTVRVDKMSYEEWKERFVEEEVENNRESDIIKVSGGRITNPDSEDGKKFADMYYQEIRKFKTDVSKIADNTGKRKQEIQRIKDYLFFNDEFEPDCAIAQSWQRLMIGKGIKKHDITLIEHELLEMKIKQENPNIEHYKAHEIACKTYDYQNEVDEYYGNLKRNKKEW